MKEGGRQGGTEGKEREREIEENPQHISKVAGNYEKTMYGEKCPSEKLNSIHF